jgi:hypothetical protein
MNQENDDEICAHCGKRQPSNYVPNNNQEEMSWIGCGNEVGCGKWFH